MSAVSAVTAAAVAVAGLLAVAACGGDTSVAERTDDTVGGVGLVPPGRDGSAASRNGGALTLPPVGTLASGGEVPIPETLVGERALGNRLLLIGDSIFAGTSQRYGGEACSTLVPLGWQVAVEAEVGRAVDFGNRVLDARPPDEWDAAVVFLGTNYGGDEVRYETELDRILDRLSPRPVVLVTVTNHGPLLPEANEVIEREVLTRSDVDVFDWTTVSEIPGVLSGDGIHPTDAGRQLLIDGLALVLGRAPVVAGAPGRCLSSEMVDDSAGRGQVPMPSAPSTTRPTSGRPVTASTTVAPATSTAPTSTAAPATTAAPTTAAPATSAPPTPESSDAPTSTAAPDQPSGDPGS